VDARPALVADDLELFSRAGVRAMKRRILLAASAAALAIVLLLILQAVRQSETTTNSNLPESRAAWPTIGVTDRSGVDVLAGLSGERSGRGS
jgi:hypothetical protein